MIKNTLVELLAKDKELKRICKGIVRGSDLWEDLFQFSLLTVLETSEEKIKEVIENKKEKAFFIKIMLNQNTSNDIKSFNKVYRTSQTYQASEFTDYITTTTSVEATKFDLETNAKYFTEIISPESILVAKTLERLIKEDNAKGSGMPYRTELFKLYKELGSCRKVQEDVGINYVSVSQTIKAIKQEIKKNK